MQGVGANYERVVPIAGDEVYVSFDEDQEVEAHPYDGVLDQPRRQVWSGVVMNREEPLSDLNLWLAATLPGYCALSAERSAQTAAPTPRWGAAAVATRDSVAYLTSCPAHRRPASFVELGVNGHGPDAVDLMDRLVDQLRSLGRPSPARAGAVVPGLSGPRRRTGRVPDRPAARVLHRQLGGVVPGRGGFRTVCQSSSMSERSSGSGVSTQPLAQVSSSRSRSKIDSANAAEPTYRVSDSSDSDSDSDS